MIPTELEIRWLEGGRYILMNALLIGVPHPVEPMGEGSDAGRDDGGKSVCDRAGYPLRAAEDGGVFEDHRCAGPGDDGGSHVR